MRTVRVLVDGEDVVDEWEGAAGEEPQAIPGVEGAVGSGLIIEGVLEVGEYLGILEVRKTFHRKAGSAKRCLMSSQHVMPTKH